MWTGLDGISKHRCFLRKNFCFTLCFLLFFLKDLPAAKMETSLAAHFPQNCFNVNVETNRAEG